MKRERGVPGEGQARKRPETEDLARIAQLEERAREIRGELRRLARHLRGNGKEGLFARVQLNHERIEALQAQWKLVAGGLIALAAAVAQAVLSR